MFRKTYSRMMASQIIYCAQYRNEGDSEQDFWLELMADISKELNQEMGKQVVTQKLFVKKIFESYSSNRIQIFSCVNSCMFGYSDIDPFLKCVLAAAATEAGFVNLKVNPAIIIDEYTNVASMFFCDQEISLVNGKLNSIIPMIRNSNLAVAVS